MARSGLWASLTTLRCVQSIPDIRRRSEVRVLAFDHNADKPDPCTRSKMSAVHHAQLRNSSHCHAAIQRAFPTADIRGGLNGFYPIRSFSARPQPSLFISRGRFLGLR
jgi:hypothetical protein